MINDFSFCSFPVETKQHQQQQRFTALKRIQVRRQRSHDPSLDYAKRSVNNFSSNNERRPNFVQSAVLAERQAKLLRVVIAQRYRLKGDLKRLLEYPKQHADDILESAPVSNDLVEHWLAVTGAESKSMAKFYLRSNNGDMNASLNQFFAYPNMYAGNGTSEMMIQAPIRLPTHIVEKLCLSSRTCIKWNTTTREWQVPSNCVRMRLGIRRYRPDPFLLTGYPSILIGATMYVNANPTLRGRNDVKLNIYKDSIIYVGIESSVVGIPTWMSNVGFTKVKNGDTNKHTMLIFTHECDNKDLCMVLYSLNVHVPRLNNKVREAKEAKETKETKDDAADHLSFVRRSKIVEIMLGSTGSQSKFVIAIQSLENHHATARREYTTQQDDPADDDISIMVETLYSVSQLSQDEKYVLAPWQEFGTNKERIPRCTSINTATTRRSKSQPRFMQQHSLYNRGSYNYYNRRHNNKTFDGHTFSSTVIPSAAPKNLRSHSHTTGASICNRTYSPRPANKTKLQHEHSFLEHMRNRKILAEIIKYQRTAEEKELIQIQTNSQVVQLRDLAKAPKEVMQVTLCLPTTIVCYDGQQYNDWRKIRFRQVPASMEGAQHNFYTAPKELDVETFLSFMNNVKNPWNVQEMLTDRVRSIMLQRRHDNVNANVNANKNEVEIIVKNLLDFALDVNPSRAFVIENYINSEESVFLELVHAERRKITKEREREERRKAELLYMYSQEEEEDDDDDDDDGGGAVAAATAAANSNGAGGFECRNSKGSGMFLGGFTGFGTSSSFGTSSGFGSTNGGNTQNTTSQTPASSRNFGSSDAFGSSRFTQDSEQAAPFIFGANPKITNPHQDEVDLSSDDDL